MNQNVERGREGRRGKKKPPRERIPRGFLGGDCYLPPPPPNVPILPPPSFFFRFEFAGFDFESHLFFAMFELVATNHAAIVKTAVNTIEEKILKCSFCDLVKEKGSSPPNPDCSVFVVSCMVPGCTDYVSRDHRYADKTDTNLGPHIMCARCFDQGRQHTFASKSYDSSGDKCRLCKDEVRAGKRDRLCIGFPMRRRQPVGALADVQRLAEEMTKASEAIDADVREQDRVATNGDTRLFAALRREMRQEQEEAASPVDPVDPVDTVASAASSPAASAASASSSSSSSMDNEDTAQQQEEEEQQEQEEQQNDQAHADPGTAAAASPRTPRTRSIEQVNNSTPDTNDTNDTNDDESDSSSSEDEDEALDKTRRRNAARAVKKQKNRAGMKNHRLQTGNQYTLLANLVAGNDPIQIHKNGAGPKILPEVVRRVEQMKKDYDAVRAERSTLQQNKQRLDRMTLHFQTMTSNLYNFLQTIDSEKYTWDKLAEKAVVPAAWAKVAAQRKASVTVQARACPPLPLSSRPIPPPVEEEEEEEGEEEGEEQENRTSLD